MPLWILTCKSGSDTDYPRQASQKKAATPVLSASISGIVNDGFDQSKFPSQSKYAEVVPIYKKDVS